MQYMIKRTLFVVTILSIISCNKYSEKSNDESATTKVTNAENTERESSLPIKQIILLAQQHFSTYQETLLSNNTAIGLSDAYTGDFTNDGEEDVVIYYSVEPTDGGNYLAGQGLVLYKNNGSGISFISNYSPDYLFSFDKVSGGNIFISKDEYASEDPRCCPSIHKQIELTIKDDKIYERKID